MVCVIIHNKHVSDLQIICPIFCPFEMARVFALLHVAHGKHIHVLVWCVGDKSAAYLVQKQDFQVYMNLYCQAIYNGCPNAGRLGIRASDLAFPNISLPDGTQYTYMYLVSCQGAVTKSARGSHILVGQQLAQSPSMSCAEKHAIINQTKGYTVRYGRLRRADAEQWAQLHPNPGGLFNASAAVAAATMRPHAKGLLAGPRLHTVKAAHVAAASKRSVFGVGQQQETFLNDVYRAQWKAMLDRIRQSKLRPAVCSLTCIVFCLRCNIGSFNTLAVSNFFIGQACIYIMAVPASA